MGCREYISRKIQDSTLDRNYTPYNTILSKYKLKYLFNSDEFGLLFQPMLDKTFTLRFEKCSSSKKSKICLAGMAVVNAFG